MPTAAQNAAHNALTQVVGSFIDAEKMLEKKVEIRDGLISQVKNIKSDIKEYSQGSIKSFEVINVREDNGIIVVTAKAVVQVEELANYFKTIVGGEQEIKGISLFAQAATKSAQNRDKVSILLDNIISPLNDVIQFQISDPKSYNASELRRESAQLKNRPDLNDQILAIESMANSFGRENIFEFDIIATLDEGFLRSASQSLEGIAKSHHKIRKELGTVERGDNYRNRLSEDDFPVYLQSKNSSYTSYIIGDTRSRLKNSGEMAAFYGDCLNDISNFKPISLVVEFSDGEGNVLQEEIVNEQALSGRVVKVMVLALDYPNGFAGSPWTMGIRNTRILCQIEGPGLYILKERRFKLLVAIDQEKLAMIKKISLKLEN